MKYLIVALPLLIAILICSSQRLEATAHQKGNCLVTVFPVHVLSGEQCPMDMVLVGVDSDTKRIACGRVQVNCR